MTHGGVGVLRAYVDGELGPARREGLERHVAACPRCRQALAAVRSDAAWARERLEGYAAAAVAGADPVVARRRLATFVGGVADRGEALAAGRSRPAMRLAWGAVRGRLAQPVRGPAVVVAAGVLLLGTLALPPVRAAAGEFLSLFQAHTVQLIQVTPSDVAAIESALKSDASAAPGDVRGLVHFTAPPRLAPVQETLEQARQAVAFPIRVPEPPPVGYEPGTVLVQPAQHIAFTLDVDALNRLLASVGSRETLPPSLQGATITLQIPASVALAYDGPHGQRLHVLEAASPTLSVPAGVDVAGVRQLLLDLPFLPADLRAQLAAVGDWQHTALVPALTGVSQEVTVGGVQGVFFEAPAQGAHGGEEAGDSALVWLQGGVVYAVTGPLTPDQAQAVAASLQ